VPLATTPHCNNDDSGCGGRLNKISEIIAELPWFFSPWPVRPPADTKQALSKGSEPFPFAARFSGRREKSDVQ
jgi:hypothetical protein